MRVVLDASPLIFLAKLDALDAITIAGHDGAVPPSVFGEVARPALAFRFPEIATITLAKEDGRIDVVSLTKGEEKLAGELGARFGGLHAGELDVLALGESRGWAVSLHERQAARLAASRGVRNVHLVEILFAGTPDSDLLERRIRHFARLTNLRVEDLDRLLDLIRERR
jgi:hypothetical protein